VSHVDLFEIARRLAGRQTVDVEARTLGEALEALGRACPALEAVVVREGRLAPHGRASRGVRASVDDPAPPLTSGEHLVLLIAMAGG